jgi:hypothetical protein
MPFSSTKKITKPSTGVAFRAYLTSSNTLRRILRSSRGIHSSSRVRFTSQFSLTRLAKSGYDDITSVVNTMKAAKKGFMGFGGALTGGGEGGEGGGGGEVGGGGGDACFVGLGGGACGGG